MKHRGTGVAGVDTEDPIEELRGRYYGRATLAPAYNELSSKVIGAAMQVHTTLGPGFLESFYERALCIELLHRGIPFQLQVPMAVSYRDQPIGGSFLDLLVDEILVVELKAIDSISTIHRMQVHSYLRAGGFQLGLIINFNVPRLRDGIARVIETPDL